jgi:outer membrane protein assembly factor BamB
LWWLFFSRAPWADRLGAVVVMAIAVLATSRIVHKSIATGAMGMLFYIYAIPTASLALVVSAAAGRRLSNGARRITMAAIILLACAAWTLLRTNGITGEGASQLAWRWSPTPEERLLAQIKTEPVDTQGPKAPVKLPPVQAGETPIAPAPVKVPDTVPVKPPLGRTGDTPKAPVSAASNELSPPEWPGFRGPWRDSRIPGVRINTDWSSSPPVELWRRPIGPGWSSFAVDGDHIYTQEQLGEDEVVACYDTAGGKPIWEHRDTARFWESNGGAGPRATPTLSGSRVYTLGATGILNALNAADGTLVWSRNVPSDAGTKVPYWGLSSSPLMVDGMVVVYAGKLAAYDSGTGKPRWFGPEGGVSYSSPQLLTIGGISQILMLCNVGTTSVAPAGGKILWQHPWGSSIVQPAQTSDGDILITAMDASGGVGTRRIAVAHGPGGWNVDERWTSNGLKPYFNDFVVHNGHAFGFDGSILACIDLQDGKRKWKGGRYGHGQLMLLPDQDLLLVLSEEGELALVGAKPDRFNELARFQAIEGKTWNHPVLVRNLLLVRNDQQMAAFRISLAGN